MSKSFAKHVSRTKGREATGGVIPGLFGLSVGLPDLPAPPGWRWTPLTSVAHLESGHTPSRRHPEYWGGDVPWIGIKDAVDHHGETIFDTYQHASELGLQNSSARLLPKDTVCLSRTASIGYVVVMGRPMATSQDFVNWVCGPRLEPDYLKYILLAERDSLVRFASGTTHQTIYYPEAKAFHVLLPPRPEQLKILQVLRSLDERAKLNDATGSTLESLARSLFHNWFIEFEPVHANASGSGKSSAGKKAKFFPASFIESQLGTIPAGWNVIKLSEILTVEKGLSYKGAFLSSDGLPLVNLGCFLGNGRFDITALKGYTGPYKEKHVVRPGDLVVANTDITQKRTVLGSPGIVFAEDGRDELLFSHHTYAVRLDPKYVDLRLYVYYQMLSDAFRDRAKGFATGTTVLALPREAILDYELVLPPRGIITSFNQIVEPIKNRQIAGALQSITLRRMRDTLLPKLLSGEVRVP